MYVCGVTPYDEPHLGHARCYIVFDVLRRYLEYKGYNVRYIQNVTDIDDKIIDRAMELGEDPNSIAERYTDEYFKYMNLLNVKPASFYPRVTEHIQRIVKVISGLIDKGYAYQVDGDVYFEVEKFPGYGGLSGRGKEARLAGVRVEIDPRKRDPADFALWKGAREGEPSWESSWGRGRPGWHIECSVLSMEYLGETFDIHGGGADLIFPHHENEIAQSCAYTGKQMAGYWLHNGFVMSGRDKMSKSLGNVLSLKDLLVKHPPEVVRSFLLRTHYRNPIDFTLGGLDQSRVGLERFYNTLDNIDWELRGKELKGTDDKDYPEIKKCREAFEESMDDDLNTPQGLAVLYDLVVKINNILAKEEKSGEDMKLLQAAKDTLLEMGDILGLFKTTEISSDDLERIEGLIKERQKVRADKDWAKADHLREELVDLGIILEDTPSGTRWRRERDS